jgi:hypothetical protein
MPEPIDKSLIQGEWLHSHDENEKSIFRPATAKLAPSRGGRSGLTFEPGGRVVRRKPGPADRGVLDEGTWSVDPEGALTMHFSDGPAETMTIDSVSPDVLILKK